MPNKGRKSYYIVICWILMFLLKSNLIIELVEPEIDLIYAIQSLLVIKF